MILVVLIQTEFLNSLTFTIEHIGLTQEEQRGGLVEGSFRFHGPAWVKKNKQTKKDRNLNWDTVDNIWCGQFWTCASTSDFINSLGKKELLVSLFCVGHRNQFSTIPIMCTNTNHIWRCSRPTWTWLSGDPLHRALQSLLWCRPAPARGRCGVWTALRACHHELHRSPCTERHWETQSSCFRMDTAALQKNGSLKDRDRKRNCDMRGSLNS